MPAIEKMYEKKLVDLSACGDLKSVKKHFSKQTKIDYKRNIISIFDMYEEISSWGIDINDNDENDDEPEEDIFSAIPEKTEPVRIGKKVGRNDPCPCGSGKKYKNCCMRKE